MIKFYGYNKCSTCIKAKKLLKARQIPFDDMDIVTHPPSEKVLKSIVGAEVYPLKKLFNTSGQLYREMGIKTKLPNMSVTEAVKLLAQHGKLIKRPIVVDGDNYVVGFDEERLNQVGV